MRWSCGKTKRINTGDLFFLMRLGIEPKGIIGCGYITSKPYFFTHWDKEKAKEGKETLRTDLAFKSLSEEPIFSLTYLKKTIQLITGRHRRVVYQFQMEFQRNFSYYCKGKVSLRLFLLTKKKYKLMQKGKLKKSQ